MEVIIQDVNKIIIPEHRHRKTFVQEDIENLASSVLKHGLFHAPVVKADGITLVAGERRLKALKELFKKKSSFSYNGLEVELGFLPVVRITSNTEIGIREAELSENIDRVSLSWREKSAAVDELHNLRSSQKEDVGETQTKEDTASEVFPEATDDRNISTKINDVSKDLIVAQFMDDPEVAKAKDRAEAIKIITKKLERRRREELAKGYKTSGNFENHSIILGDVLEELPKIERNRVNCVIVDPPYGVDADTFNNQAASKHLYKDDVGYSNAIGTFILEECLALTKKEAHLYMFTDINRFLVLERGG